MCYTVHYKNQNIFFFVFFCFQILVFYFSHTRNTDQIFTNLDKSIWAQSFRLDFVLYTTQQRQGIIKVLSKM